MLKTRKSWRCWCYWHQQWLTSKFTRQFCLFILPSSFHNIHLQLFVSQSFMQSSILISELLQSKKMYNIFHVVCCNVVSNKYQRLCINIPDIKEKINNNKYNSFAKYFLRDFFCGRTIFQGDTFVIFFPIDITKLWPRGHP